jgi:hypothetical protein
MPLDLFFPPENIGGPRTGRGIPGEKDRVGRAKDVCAPCPVRRECLDYALTCGCTGIYGGTTEAERKSAVSRA